MENINLTQLTPEQLQQLEGQIKAKEGRPPPNHAFKILITINAWLARRWSSRSRTLRTCRLSLRLPRILCALISTQYWNSKPSFTASKRGNSRTNSPTMTTRYAYESDTTWSTLMMTLWRLVSRWCALTLAPWLRMRSLKTWSTW